MSLSDKKAVSSLDTMLTNKAYGTLVKEKMQKYKFYETFNIFSEHQRPGNGHKQTQYCDHTRLVCKH